MLEMYNQYPGHPTFSIPINPFTTQPPPNMDPIYLPKRPYVFYGGQPTSPIHHHIPPHHYQPQQYLIPSPRIHNQTEINHPISSPLPTRPSYSQGPISSPILSSGSASPISHRSRSPMIEMSSPRSSHFESCSEDDEEQQPCIKCKFTDCVLCNRERPTMLMKVPTWASIMKVVLFTLHSEYPEKQFFSLKNDVYGFMETHWKRLYIKKKKSDNWRKQVQDMLSHSKNIFESGYEALGQNGFWRLRNVQDPWIINEAQGNIRASPSDNQKKRQLESPSIDSPSQSYIDDDTNSLSSLTNSDDSHAVYTRKGRRTVTNNSPRRKSSPDIPTRTETIALRGELSDLANQINDMRENINKNNNLNNNQRLQKLKELEENMEQLSKIENKLGMIEMNDKNETSVQSTNNNNNNELNHQCLDIYKTFMEEKSSNDDLNLTNNNNSSDLQWRNSLFVDFTKRFPLNNSITTNSIIIPNNNNNNNENTQTQYYQYPNFFHKKSVST